MLNIIKAEIYKYIHRPYFYIITFIVSSIILLTEVVFSSNMTNRVFVISEVCPAGIGFALLLIVLFSLVFFEEYKYNSLKNLITSNVSREKIYLGKVIVQILIIILMGIIIIGVFLCGLLLLNPGDGYNNDMLIRLLIKIVALLPVLLAGLALSNLLVIGIKKEGIAIVSYITILLILTDIIKLLSRSVWSKLIIVNDYLFYNQTSIMSNLSAGNNEIIHVLLVGIVSFIIFTTLGGLLFKRTEVK
ncbi:hypothetical protein psyc5s11_26650 [Clostridium gelidum]|uniref:ABC-2 family transporter protein n=1 Tax=Clostridium gelidum TaxID=704125 RepID=A0ABM7TC00_9CLOT|nr:ABC transporter permease [Clostridium gelidum]BCZ46598.1 hypothetical protein psyc5s11_26650 [Clostridium gelidum]